MYGYGRDSVLFCGHISAKFGAESASAWNVFLGDTSGAAVRHLNTYGSSILVLLRTLSVSYLRNTSVCVRLHFLFKYSGPWIFV
jgi:hypothetical protein